MNYTLPLAQFHKMVKKQPNKNYLHQPINRQLKIFTWAQVDQNARSIANSLLKMGLNKGDRVGILSKNCAEWFIADLAIMMAGLISVPIYSTANRETISYIVQDSDCKVVFVGLLDELAEADAGISAGVVRIVFPYPSINGQFQWQTLLEEQPLESPYEPKPEETMSIAYTSGSSGKPKGVVLSFLNFASSSIEAARKVNLGVNDSLISYLPLAHITERTVIELPSIYSGSKVYFVEKLETFIADVKVAQPALFISVPRLWKKFQGEILNKIPEHKLQKLLKTPLLGRLVAKKIRKGLGLNKTKVFGSGTAPISPEVLRWYEKLGMPISEGWGMTETTGLSCSNIPFESSALGTIGNPLPCVEMKLGDNSEILIKGSAVFKAYYNLSEVTKQSFSGDWFHTGDVGAIAENGEYKIIGRLKEKFKTAKGKFVVPVPIESMLASNVDIEQTCVIGQGRKQPIALVVMNEQSKQKTDAIISSLQQTLENTNNKLESHQRLDHIIVLKETWTPHNFLTPTLKLKRMEIESAFKHFMEQDISTAVFWET